MVLAEPDLSAALSATRSLIESGCDRPIFEATLEHDGVLVRIDILEPDGRAGWRMAEVKGSVRLKTTTAQISRRSCGSPGILVYPSAQPRSGTSPCRHSAG